MQDDTRSRFNGLGIEVSMKGGLPTVVSPMEDTPAAKAGILSGDQILKINGTATDRMELQDAVNLLRGVPGQKVTLTLLRPSTKEVKDYVLERGNKSAERERRAVARCRTDRAIQNRGLHSAHPIQRTDGRRIGQGARRIAEARHAGARSRSSQQSGRTVEQRGRCLRTIFPAEHQSRFHAGPRAFAAARLHDIGRGQGTPEFPDGRAHQRRQRQRGARLLPAR